MPDLEQFLERARGLHSFALVTPADANALRALAPILKREGFDTALLFRFTECSATTDELERQWQELKARLIDHAMTCASVDPKLKPAYERLAIQKSDTGDDIALLDGEPHRLTGANDATFIQILQQKQGVPILANTLESQCGERPARIYERLPKPIQDIIDKPGQRTGKKGYRMR